MWRGSSYQHSRYMGLDADALRTMNMALQLYR